MKKSLSTLVACLMALTFVAPAHAKFLDSYAQSELLNAYYSAVAAYNEKPSDDANMECYYGYYAYYYFTIGVFYNNDTYRYYGYAFARNMFDYATVAQNNSPNATASLSANIYAAYIHSYLGFYYAYYASAGFF